MWRLDLFAAVVSTLPVSMEAGIQPRGICMDPSGFLVFADNIGNIIRRVTSEGAIRTALLVEDNSVFDLIRCLQE